MLIWNIFEIIASTISYSIILLNFLFRFRINYVYISAKNHQTRSYLPGLERINTYKSLWLKHWAEFGRVYQLKYETVFGVITEEKIIEVRKLMECGRFSNGFERHKCPECGTVLIVPFTCKSRLCLSCARKRLFGWSLNLSLVMNTLLKHSHITFTVPGSVGDMLFERGYHADQMIPLSANLFRNMLLTSAKLNGKEYQPGILAALHKCGNGLNYNPHVHLAATTEIVNLKTGEIIKNVFLPYKQMRQVWKKAFLAHLKKKGIISDIECRELDDKYQSGFHVYFQPITADNKEDILFKTAEYIAAGYFHNSQIIAVDHLEKTVTFRYKSWVDRISREKSFKTITMDIYEFMARMIYFLPDKHKKMIRYYGLYSHGIKDKLAEIDRRTWARAIEHSFLKNPEICPQCSAVMRKETVFSFFADKEIRKLFRTHEIEEGYFVPREPAGEPP